MHTARQCGCTEFGLEMKQIQSVPKIDIADLSTYTILVKRVKDKDTLHFVADMETTIPKHQQELLSVEISWEQDTFTV